VSTGTTSDREGCLRKRRGEARRADGDFSVTAIVDAACVPDGTRHGRRPVTDTATIARSDRPRSRPRVRVRAVVCGRRVGDRSCVISAAVTGDRRTRAESPARGGHVHGWSLTVRPHTTIDQIDRSMCCCRRFNCGGDKFY